MKRERLIKYLGLFFAVMLALTVLSRAADSVSTAQVSVRTMQNQVITHRVRGTGRVEGTRETAVFAREGQRVEQILVQEGESVKKEQVLLRLSKETLSDSIKEKEDELEELNLQEQDLLSADSVNAAKKDLEQSRAWEDYDLAVHNGDVDIYNARTALDTAQQRLNEYYASREVFSSGEETDDSEEQALLADVRAKQEALNQAILSKNQGTLSAKRSVEDANLADPADGSLRNIQRKIENAKEELTELQELLNQEGEIRAPSDGVVKTIAVTTGGTTSFEAAAVLYNTGGTFRMTASVSKDDVKYVEVGGSVHVEGTSGAQTDEARVESIREDETDEDLRTVTFLIPKDTLSIGESADFTISQDAGPFATCVPISALYGQSGQEYVMVLDTENSVLGEVQIVRKVDVTVEDKNETLAVLGSGALTGAQQIVVASDRAISDGSRVRLRES